jgi:actin-related protein
MATASPSPAPAPDYFAGKPARPLHARHGSGSPRTPLLGRSISSQFGSPGSFRAEQEECVVYELGARHLSAGFAGESKPRCVVRFSPSQTTRVGDYRQWDVGSANNRRKNVRHGGWGEEYGLYRNDIRGLDLGLMEDKLERTVRQIHTDHLQLDQKPRKAVLAIASLLPTPLLEIALKVLFNHSAQPPSVMILTTPILNTVSAGLRCALVVEVGWEESIVTAVGEYKEVFQRRSIRAGKMLTQEMRKVLEEEAKKNEGTRVATIDFELAEEVTERLGWCQLQANEVRSGAKAIPLPSTKGSRSLEIPFQHLCQPAETALFAPDSKSSDTDDHDLPIPQLAYNVLLALPMDLRALCTSRILIAGGVSRLPGLKHRLLHELQQIIQTRGWDPVRTYGSATEHHNRILQERDANIARIQQQPSPEAHEVQLSPLKKPIQETLPHHRRVHDDVRDPITLKAERHTMARQKPEPAKAQVRGVETLGAWAGASLVASLRVRGVHEVEREEFLRYGVRVVDGSVF